MTVKEARLILSSRTEAVHMQVVGKKGFFKKNQPPEIGKILLE